MVIGAIAFLAASWPLRGQDEEPAPAPEAELDAEGKQQRFRELSRLFQAELAKAAWEREPTITALGALRHEPATQLLLRQFDRESKEDTALIKFYLGAFGKSQHRDAVKKALTDGFRLLKEEDFPAIAAAFARVKDPDAVKWLVETGWGSIPTLPPRAQETFLRVLLGTDDPRMLRAANGLIAEETCGPQIQIELVRILRRYKDNSSARKIARLYRLRDRDLQVEVLLALRDMEATEHSQTFIDALKNSYWQVRTIAVDILRDTHQAELMPLLVPLLEDPVVQVQVAVVQALRAVGGKTVVPHLIAALESEHGRVQDDASDALLWLTGKDFGPDHVTWSEWWKGEGQNAEIKGISREQYDELRKKREDATTGVYYGLRIISQYICFVVDVSASMDEPYQVYEEEESPGSERREGATGLDPARRGERTGNRVQRRKIDVARRELTRAVSGIPDGTHFNIIKFSSQFEPWKPGLIVMDERVRGEALAYVRDLASGGTTNIYDTLAHAMGDPDVNTIYFLSDGAPTAGTYQDTATILARIAEANQTRKIKIHTIGFHLDTVATELMSKLAEENFGSFVPR